MTSYQALRVADPVVFEAFEMKLQRQRKNLELIASENYVSVAVMITSGNHFTHKIAERYPGHRYYGGCENVDVFEEVARSRAKEQFGAAQSMPTSSHTVRPSRTWRFFYHPNGGRRLVSF